MTNWSDWKKLFDGGVHPRGLAIALGLAVVGALAFLFVPSWVGTGVLVVAVLTLLFFRDPERVPPEDGVVSPADGIVVQVSRGVSAPPELGFSREKWQKIGIFMSVLNVHVNRSPVQGDVVKRIYRPGMFKNALSSVEKNERLSLVIRRKDGSSVICTQIAGLIARRIVCDAQKGDALKLGQRYGVICFGSRLDVYLPEDEPVIVRLGQRMVAGETFLTLPRS